MTVLYGTQMTKLNAGTPADPGFVDGGVKSFMESVTLASQTTADTIAVARLPKGAVLRGARIMTSVTLGAATIAIGITGDAGKYRAAAVFTTVETWESLDTTSLLHTALSAEEEVIVTIGAASLPAAGTLLVQFDYTFD